MKWDEVSHLQMRTWSPSVVTLPPHLEDFGLYPFSGFLSNFSNGMYDIKNLLGVNGLSVSIFSSSALSLFTVSLLTGEVTLLGRITASTRLA